MDLRDITGNVMLLTDDDEANDTDAWLAFTLTGIGLVPVVGSAVKGVGKVILKNTGESLSAALAVLRKLGKGDPVKYLRNINWQDLGKQSATEVKNIVKGLRDSLDDMSTSWHYDLLLPDAAIEGMQATVKRLDEVTPKIDQHMQQAAQEIGQRVNKALDEYQGQPPIRGVTDKPTKAKADELEPPKGNELPGTKVSKLTDPRLQKHYKDVSAYMAHYKSRMDQAIRNGDSSRKIGAFKAKITEGKGELAAAMHMEKHFSKPPPPAKMEMGFGPGPGIDQIWVKRDGKGNIIEYFAVEAKGPGATLKKTKTMQTQMSLFWLRANAKKMKNSKKYKSKNQLGSDLLRAMKSGTPPVRRLVIEAVEKNGSVVSSKLQPLP